MMQYDDITHEIISAAILVHRKLGPGFLESIYENALWGGHCEGLAIKAMEKQNVPQQSLDRRVITAIVGKPE